MNKGASDNGNGSKIRTFMSVLMGFIAVGAIIGGAVSFYVQTSITDRTRRIDEAIAAINTTIATHEREIQALQDDNERLRETWTKVVSRAIDGKRDE